VPATFGFGRDPGVRAGPRRIVIGDRFADRRQYMNSTAGRTLGRVALVAATGLGAGLAGAVPAEAATAAPRAGCIVDHDLYQQPVATVVAYVDASICTPPMNVSLKVYRNGVLISSISGSQAPSFAYHCTTTTPTRWRTNWDPEEIFNCG
jgi:hypothetical protein